MHIKSVLNPLNLAITLLSISQLANSQAVLNPNQIVGTISFSNQNTEVVNLLTSGGLGMNAANISASSINYTEQLNAYANVYSESRLTINYELSLESSTQGIAYKIRPTLRSGKSYYYPETVNSDSLYPEPASDVRVDYNECAGIADIHFVDTQGSPVTVYGDTISARRETSAGSGYFNTMTAHANPRKNISQLYLPVAGIDSAQSLAIKYGIILDDSATVTDSCEAIEIVSCDTIVAIECVIDPGNLELGNVKGRIGVNNEPLSGVASMRLYGGPQNEYKSVESDSAGNYHIENLLDSGSSNYYLSGDYLIRSGYRSQFITTPRLGGSNASLVVNSGETTNLGDLFVFNPGYVKGNIELVGPSAGEFGTGLEDIFRDADINASQARRPYSTHVGATGAGTAEGASYSTNNAGAQTSFSGQYNADSQQFEGEYELVLGGLDGENSLWQTNVLQLRFIDQSDWSIPQSMQNSQIKITNKLIDKTTIIPGQSSNRDIHYCFNDVELKFRTTSGVFYSPNVKGSGRNLGTNYRNESADYHVRVDYATGTPYSSRTPASEGLVVMTLPKGSYELKPYVHVTSSQGAASRAQLPKVDLTVGCGQRVAITTSMQLAVDETPTTTTDSSVHIEGDFNTTVPLTALTYTHNERAPVDICDDCQENSSFSFDVDLDEGDNTITVHARNEDGEDASVQTSVNYDAPQPTPSPSPTPTPEPSPTPEPETNSSSSCGYEAGDSLISQRVSKPLLWPPVHTLTNVGLQHSIVDCDSALKTNVVTEVWSNELEGSTNDSTDDSTDDSTETGSGEDGDCKCGLRTREDAEAAFEELLASRSDATSDLDGYGSGYSYAPDVERTSSSLSLRQERETGGEGRIYLIITRTTDTLNNSHHACSTVVVPEEFSRNSIIAIQDLAVLAKAHCDELGDAPAGYYQMGD